MARILPADSALLHGRLRTTTRRVFFLAAGREGAGTGSFLAGDSLRGAAWHIGMEGVPWATTQEAAETVIFAQRGSSNL